MDTLTTERLGAIEEELKNLRRNLAGNADITEMKWWLLWRFLIASAVIQGLIAAAGVKFLLDRIGPTLVQQMIEAIKGTFLGINAGELSP